jgi:hypothetical protein
MKKNPIPACSLALAALVALPAAARAEKIEKKLSNAAEMALCAHKLSRDVSLNGHDFNVKGATVVHPIGDATKIDFLTGQVSHKLRFRPDDQVHYQVTYQKDGSPGDAKLDISRGGVSSMLAFLNDIVTGFGLTKIKILGNEVEWNPAALGMAATRISQWAEGKGWEGQVAAMIRFTSLAGQNQPAFCQSLGYTSWR